MTDPETWLAARIAAGRPAETWKAVPGWPHEASDQGRIRTAKGRVLTQRAHNRPREVPPERRYRKADLCRGAEKVTVLVHQVVLAAFDGPCPPGQQSRHLDDVPVHNWWPENLAWGTPDQNAADKARQARYHTPEAKARRSRAPRRDQANTPSPKPRLRDRRRWLRKVAATLRGRERGDGE